MQHTGVQEVQGDERAELPKEGFWEEPWLGMRPLFPDGGCVGGSEMCSLPGPGITVSAEDSVLVLCLG